ncbi:hypothetical protein FHS95_000908 [Sphingomonas naasensis]|nr:hypothetical protein [Sphingomonas naasensis]
MDLTLTAMPTRLAAKESSAHVRFDLRFPSRLVHA